MTMYSQNFRRSRAKVSSPEVVEDSVLRIPAIETFPKFNAETGLMDFHFVYHGDRPGRIRYSFFRDLQRDALLLAEREGKNLVRLDARLQFSFVLGDHFLLPWGELDKFEIRHKNQLIAQSSSWVAIRAAFASMCSAAAQQKLFTEEQRQKTLSELMIFAVVELSPAEVSNAA